MARRSFVGVLIGNVIGVLPGMGIMATISILLPLTFGMPEGTGGVALEEP